MRRIGTQVEGDGEIAGSIVGNVDLSFSGGSEAGYMPAWPLQRSITANRGRSGHKQLSGR